MRRSSRLTEGPAPGRRMRRAAIAACLSATALGGIASPALAVDPTITTDANDGCNVNGCSLREAINATPSGGVINLAAGTQYSLSIGGTDDTNATGDLDLTKNVTINGGGMKSTFIRSDNPGPVDGVLHVLAPVTLNNVAVVLGVRTGSDIQGSAGGGIRVGNPGGPAGTLSADHVQVAFNEAHNGGGVYVAGGTGRSSATFTSSLIFNNTGRQYGGAIANYGDVTFRKSAMLGNSARYGGGLLQWSTKPAANFTSTNSTIGDNNAAVTGGGMQTAGNVTLNATTINKNVADKGKNILLDGGGYTVRDSILGGSSEGCAFSDTSSVADISSSGGNMEQGHSCLGEDLDGDGAFSPRNSTDRIDLPDTGPGGLNLASPDVANGVYYYGLVSPSLGTSVALDGGRDFCRDLDDQVGTARPQGVRCDVGAIEYIAPPPEAFVDVGFQSFVENPDPAVVGDDLTYNIVVENIGTATANDVVITTSVPTNTTFVSASNGCSRPKSPDSLRCELGNIAPGGTATVQLTVKVTKAGPVSNRADVSSASIDVNKGNNQARTEATVNPNVQPDPKVTVKLVKAVKLTDKSVSFLVDVNRDGSNARVALFTSKYGTLVVKNVKFATAGSKTVKLKLSKKTRSKLAKLKKGTKLSLQVQVDLPGGDELNKSVKLKITKKGKLGK